MKLRSLLCVLVGLFLTVSTVQAATECTAVFPDGLSSNNSGGEIKLKSSSRINNSPDSILDTKSISGSGSNSCPPSSCSASGNAASSIDYNSFSGNSDYELDEGDSETLSPGNYKEGKIKKNATLRLSAGDYTFKDDFELEEGARIIINSGPVRILVKKDVKIEKNTQVNVGGSAADLLIYSRDKIEIKDDAEVTAFLYSKDDLKIEEDAVVNGAASGKKVELKEDATVNFLAAEQAKADFGNLCEAGDGGDGGDGGNSCPLIFPSSPVSNSSLGLTPLSGSGSALSYGKESEITFNADNTYFYTSGSIGKESEVEISGSGTVRLQFSGDLDIAKETEINVDGKPEDLIIYVGGDLYIAKESEVNAIIYVAGDATLDKESKFDGAFTVAGSLSQGKDIDFDYDAGAITDANFAGMCGGSSDTTPPELSTVTASCSALTTVNVSFSEAVDNATASSTGNYSLVNTDTSSSVSISSASVSGSTVTLITATLVSGNYQLTVNNVEDSSGNVIDNNSQASFSLDCDLPNPRLEYRFDQCDLSTGVPDSANSYDGTANNTESTDEQYLINLSLDLTATDTSDYVTVPRSAVNGLNDFSISTWIKTNQSPSQQEIFQALGSNANDDEIEIYLVGSNQVRMNVGDSGNTVSAGKTLTDNNWHHLLITRSGRDMCLYVDGNLANCHDDGGNSSVSIGNSSGVIIGQEQDSYGGSFDSSQSWKGYIDEFKIYGSKLEEFHADQIYTNEAAGRNADGTTRSPVTCEAPPLPDPRLEYRFDECTLVEGITDSVGSYDGTANNTESTDDQYVINRSLDLSVTDTSDYVTVPMGSVNGLNDFSISTWIKTNTSPSQQEIFQALGSSSGDNEIEIYLIGSDEVQMNVGNQGNKVDAGKSLTDNSWHHLLITRSGNDMCLYVDGSLANCHDDGSGSQISINNGSSVIIGQEQDSFGGSFDSGQSWKGYIDEFKIYASALEADHASQIYTNELAGKNADDTDRDPVTCLVTLPDPLAEYRMDETSWDGSDDEVVDSVGLYHGEAINSSPVEGKICNAADLSTTGTSDYLKLNGSFFSNQGDFTISTWVNTSDATNQALISGANSGTSNELIFWFDSSTSFRPHLNDGDGGSISASNFANGSWRHLVWTREGTENCLYIDKTLQGCKSLNSTNISIASNGLIIGQEQDNLGGGFDDGQDYRGLLDELIFFGEALSQSQVELLFDNQDAGLNYDGTSRGDCATQSISPVADWRFDEGSWSGTDDVIDSSGNNYHGTATNSSPSSDAQLCNSADLSLAGNTDFIALDKDAMDGLKDFTVIVWAKTSSNQDSTIISAASGNSGAATNEAVWYFDNSDRFWPTITDSPFDEATRMSSTSTVRDGNWHQLAWTRKANSLQSCFFIDGVSQGCITHPDSNDSDPISVATGGLILGQEQDSVGGGFDNSQDWVGKLDELLIFDSVLSQADISDIRTNIMNSNNWDGTPRICQSSIDHYSISHSGTGVTCLAEQVTITAHDSNHDPIDAGEATITLSTGTGKGDWTSIISGGGSLANGAADDGAATYTFASGSSSVVLEFLHTTEGTFGFGVSDGSTTETSGSADASDDPDLTIGGAVLKFVNSAGTPLNISTQISAKDSTGVYLKAFEADEADPTTCSSPISSTKAVGFAASCINPSTCASGQSFSVEGTNVNLHNNGASLSYTNVNITFDANSMSSTPVDLNYSDAGQVRLNMYLSDPVMSGQSNDFIVRPFAFGFPSIMAGSTSNTAGDEVGGNGFTSAGSDFDITINAYLYHSDDDSNGDGIPDAGADVTDNGVTPNFTGTANISIDAYTPASGVEGNLTGATSPLLDTYANRSGNNVTATLQYDEVGSVSILAQMNDYLGDTDADIQSVSTKIGRFYPDYFAFSDDAVTASCSVYTYMQQPFPSIAYRLEARAANDQVTENYDLSLYSNTASFELLAEDSDNGVDLSGRVNTSSSLAGWSAGVVDRTSGSALTDVIFTRSGGAAGLEDGPYTQLQLGLRVDSELDNRDFADADRDMNAATAGNCGSSCDAVSLGSAQELRYGRLSITSAHGPETEVIPVPFVTQYWDGNAFVTNTDDSCTVLSKANIIFNSVLLTTSMDVDFDTDADVETTGSFTTETATDVTASSGDFGLLFSAPGIGTGDADNTGSFPVDIINIDAWLRYDWDQDGSADDTEARGALVTFGRARGNDRMIFWQERYR
ncbi:DUF6701 domain-containing protein [Neptuniibacter sp.]|uniref:DUF6701 domain-containing protein n=1 Tax=Neptuniibacter sp. TaxID=1962643 RepID=UPI0026285F54|nr:DUF6701 domain-containing protein [Neptuniibacter sp.]MCP4598799.1 hypothetical protein [Neptuniibacter sp.]